jgi:hypothetical protein
LYDEYVHKANESKNNKDFDGSIAYFDKAIEINPTLAKAYNFKGKYF